MLDYHAAMQEIAALVLVQWDYRPDVSNAGSDLAYIHEHQRHPFPRLKKPGALPRGGRQRGSRGWDGGRGGHQMEVGKGPEKGGGGRGHKL